MCLFGTPSSPVAPPPPPKKVVEPGPASQPDKVNQIQVPNANDPAQQQAKQNENKASQATGQTTKITNKAY